VTPTPTPDQGPILATERLRLVPVDFDHVDALHALLTQEAVRRYLLDDRTVERKWVVDFAESSRRTFADQGFGLWAVTPRAGGGVVGLAGLWVFPGVREPQLLYALDPAEWGKGFATEASKAVIDDAFDRLDLAEVLASTDPPNRASIRVMERLGMRFLEASNAGGHPLVLYRLRKNGR